MKILVINSGSSSIKSTLFDFNKSVSGKKSQIEIARITIDDIGLKNCKFIFNKFTKTKVKNSEKRHIIHHEAGVKLILETLLKTKCLQSLDEIVAVGHRVVHGGEKHLKPTLLNSKILKEIEKISPLAPLQNPANIISIKACQKLLPKAKHLAVFDTAFYQTLPEKAYLYALPKSFYTKYQIRRYGFHGTSHKYVINEAFKIIKNKNAKIVSCHLGSGSSITASIGGKPVDTSMGFTPMEGVPMATRSGSIDPGIILYLTEKLKFKSEKVDEILNHKSGLLALSGISPDMREIYQQSQKGNKHAQLAIEIFAYSIAKYCGSFAAAMNGIDALIFTGGIGENASYVREKVCAYLKFLHLKKVLVIPTNEDLQIATETLDLL